MTSNIDPDNDALSVVEDLDPEPEPGGKRIWRSSRMRDLVLGLAILLGVVGWAGYSSWHDESNRSNYAQAQQDASLHHWDDALAHYSSAKGYKDADALAANASKQIEARDSRYQAAKSYSQTGPAIQELLAARAVQTIEPGYKDIDVVASRAEAQVYTDALSGTVAIRTEADPPGLYYRGPNGWAYLRGSDQWSRVLSIPFSAVSANHIVYDIAGPNWKAPGPIIKSPFGPYGYPIAQGSPDKVGRRLVMAELSGESGDPKFVDLQLNPMDYNFYVCGSAGVWGIRYDPGISDTIIAKGILDGFSPTYEATAPQAGGKGIDIVAPVATPGTDGVVADFGHGGTAADELLLAAHGAQGTRGGADNKSSTELYLAGADGSHPRLVFSTTGTLASALLSPDDRHALVVASEAPANLAGSLAVSAILLTLDGSIPPRTLQRISLDEASAAYNIPSPLAGRLSLSGVFLENGVFKNKLLLSWSEGSPVTGIRIRLLDVANPDNILTEADMPDEQIGVLPVVESPDGRSLLLYEQDAAPTPVAGKPLTVYLEVLQAETGTGKVKANGYNIPLPPANASSDSTPYFMNPTVRGSNLIYSVETFTTMPETTSAYSLPLADPSDQNSDGRGAAQPLQLFSHIWPATQSIGDTGPEPVGVPGPGAYASTDSSGTLHAHLYDAAGDISLEPGVGTIFELSASYFYKVLH